MARRTIVGPATTAFAASLLVILASPASSAEDPPPPPLEINLDLSADEIAGIQRAANAERAEGNEPEELRGLRRSLTQRAASSGTTYLADDTEAFALSDDVTMAVPRDTVVESVSVHAGREGDLDTVVADVSSAEGDDLQMAPVQGQGMGWHYRHSNVYVIKIRGAGEMESSYKKYRYEGNDAPDLMSMRRKGMGRAYDIGGYNYSVTGMYISSHVRDRYKSNVRYRWNAKPSSDFTGNCDNGAFSLGIKGLGWSFVDCDKYDIRWNSNYPGYYRNYMTQGNVFHRGDRQVGFHNVVAIKNHSAVGYKHYQRLEMARYVYPADKCASWNSSKRCS